MSLIEMLQASVVKEMLDTKVLMAKGALTLLRYGIEIAKIKFAVEGPAKVYYDNGAAGMEMANRLYDPDKPSLPFWWYKEVWGAYSKMYIYGVHMWGLAQDMKRRAFWEDLVLYFIINAQPLRIPPNTKLITLKSLHWTPGLVPRLVGKKILTERFPLLKWNPGAAVYEVYNMWKNGVSVWGIIKTFTPELPWLRQLDQVLPATNNFFDKTTNFYNEYPNKEQLTVNIWVLSIMQSVIDIIVGGMA